ncbi:MAG: thiamine pyrophosphate-dependent enzyme [Myxococcota bacterium]
MPIAQRPDETVATPELYQILSADGTQLRPLPEALTTDVQLRMYRFMRLNRLLDERMVKLQRQGRIGFYGPCTGQEATPVATAAALQPTDLIFPGLREGVAMLYRGFSLETFLCQVFGNQKDVLKGRQMPSHYADRSVNVVSWSSCIGPQLTQAVGAAWAAKLRRSGEICVGFMGDGATSSADFHTALNFAGVYRTPCVLICQNNHWSISVPTRGQTASRTLAEKAVAYGLPYARVDGNDAFAVFDAVSEAAQRARKGGGATFLEMLTYRIGAHSTSDDPRVYRDEREVEQWKKRDPIQRLFRFSIRKKAWSEDRDEALTVELDQYIQAELESAERRPAPAIETLFEDVYATMPWHLREQAADLAEHKASPAS